MGVRIFDECQFPGIRNPDFYTADARVALATSRPVEPAKPTPYPSPTPYPTRTPLPTPADPRQMQKFMDDSQKQGREYQDLRVQQGQDFEKLRSQQGDEYAAAMKRYGDERESWQRNREKAISAAENNIDVIVDNYGRTFKGSVLSRWLAMGGILLGVFGLVIGFQKRKDVV